MKSKQVPYGQRSVSLSLPEKWDVTVEDVDRVDQRPELSQEQVEAHLHQQVEPRLKQVLSDSPEEVTLAIPDHTRGASQRMVVKSFWSFLDDVFPDVDVGLELLIASGRHAHPDDEQMRLIVPGEVQADDRVHMHVHDAFHADELRETDVRINQTRIRLQRSIFESDCVVLYGWVKFHYLAGFGGGPKTICPGLGGDASITAVHRQSMVDEDEQGKIGPGIYEGNHMQKAIKQIYRSIPTDHMIGIQGVMNRSGKLAELYSGSLIDCQQAAIESFRDRFQVQVDGTYDCLIVSPGGYPKDVDLIQAHKTLQHTSALWDPDTQVAFLAECPDGYGADLMRSWLQKGDSEAIRSALKTDFQVYGRTAMSFKEITERTNLSMLTSPELKDLEDMGIPVHQKWTSLRDQLEHAFRDQEEVRVLVLPEAANVLYKQ